MVVTDSIMDLAEYIWSFVWAEVPKQRCRNAPLVKSVIKEQVMLGMLPDPPSPVSVLEKSVIL